MPLRSASEVLSGVERGARTAVEELLDSVEQRSRDKSRPASPAEQAWDQMMRMRREGASMEELDKARQRYLQLRDGKQPQE